MNGKKTGFLFFTMVISMIIFLVLPGCVSVESLLRDGKYIEADKMCAQRAQLEQKDCYKKIARAYLASGSLDEAGKYFEKAGDKDGLKLVAELFLKKKEFKSAANYLAKSRGTIVFKEEFANNIHKWPESDTEKIHRKIENHKYIFHHKRNKGSWFSWPGRQNFSLKNDYKIELVFTRLEGESSCALAWGMNNVKYNYLFGIYSNGNYYFGKFENSKWKSIIPGTPSEFINKNFTENKLTIEKTGSIYRFFINDHYVCKAAYSGVFGNKTGIYLDKAIKISATRLVVTEYPSLNNILLEIAGQNLKDKDYNSAVQNFKSAGLTDNQMFMELGKHYHASHNTKAAMDSFLKAGWTKDKIKADHILQEQFINNKNKWGVGDEKAFTLEIKADVLIFNHKRKKGAYFTWKKTSLNTNSDFIIEAVMKKISGRNTYPYEILYGFKQVDNYYTFGLTGSGKFIYGAYENNTWITLKNYTECKYIKKNNSWNKISIVKSGKNMEFFINDNLVHRADAGILSGRKVGFQINRDIKIAVDYLTVTNLPPEELLQIYADQFETEKDRAGLKNIAEIYYLKKNNLLGDKYRKLAGLKEIKHKDYDVDICFKALKKMELNQQTINTVESVFGKTSLISSLKMMYPYTDKKGRIFLYNTIATLKKK